MDGTVKRRIGVILHYAINQVLVISAKSNRTTVCLYNAYIRFRQSECDETASVVSEGYNCLCKCRFVLIATFQV